jgi:hypothetical protein
MRSAPRRANSVALVVCEDNSRVFSEPFFPLLPRSLSRVVSDQGTAPTAFYFNGTVCAND